MATKCNVSNNSLSREDNDIKLAESNSVAAIPFSNDEERNFAKDEESATERNPLMMEDPVAEKREKDEKDTCSCCKYKYNWRILLPINCCCKSSELTNLENAGFLEFFAITWASDIITTGFKKTLKQTDLERLSESETTSFNYNKFFRCYNEEKEKRKADDVPVGRILFKIVKTKYIFAVIYLLASLLLQLFTAGFVLNRLLSFIEEPGGSVWIGIKWVLVLVVAQFCLSLLSSGLFSLMIRAGVAARATVLSIIYNKLTRLKSTGTKSVGELVNLCANDTQRVFECCQFGAFLIGAPFLVIIVSVYLYVMFGPSSLIGVLVMILFLPIQVLLGKVISKIRAKVILITDKRVKLISEVLTCIKLIKMYAWEKSFLKEIFELRSKERRHLAAVLYVQAINMSMSLLLTAAAPVATFAAHIAFGNNLTVAEAFTVIVMFNIFPRNIALLPMAVRGFSEAANAMKRLRNLLKLEEYVPYEDEPEDQSVAIEMLKCDFSWPTPVAEKTSKDPDLQKKESGDANGSHVEPSNDSSKNSENHDVKFKPEKSNGSTKKKNKKAETFDFSLSPTLFDINLSVKKGSLIGICGGVGSGKSSLLQAILAQMHCTSGNVKVIKSVAYVAQQAWIIHDTIRNNITLRNEYREKEYRIACEACCLKADLDSFENGDLTEIGERGLNLSGGQKQRVSLARALYSNADLYLLDDPLSAVDANVGQHIFQHCIKEQLRNKTVIFVTHQLQYLNECDEVICMSNGRIEEHGTFKELMDTGREFSQLIKKFRKEHGEEKKNRHESLTKNDDVVKSTTESAADPEDGLRLRTRSRLGSTASSIESGFEIDLELAADSNDADEDDVKRIEKGKMVKEEETSTGAVTWSTYRFFCKAGGGYLAALGAFISQFSVLVVVFFVEWWLSKWLQTASKPIFVGNSTVPEVVSLAKNPETSFFMTVYVSTGCSMFFLQILSSMFFVIFFITASTNLHKRALHSVLKCPMKFFDTTPTGRILNRFSRDQDELDGRLPFISETFLRNGGRISISLIFIAVIFPWFLVALVPLSILFILLNRIFRRTGRELKRLDNITRSPMFSHLAATVQGLTTIHAYGKTNDFRNQFYNYVNQNTSPLFLYHISNQWLRVRLDTLCIVITTVTAIIAIFTKGSVHAALAGLAITYSMRMTGLFQFVCRLAAEAEARFTSVERMTSYAYSLEPEDPNPIHEVPPTKWPDAGEIKFENVQLRYRPGLPLVLKDVTFSVSSKEKIGIAGRTGAGKSSLAVALFRLAEINEGRILIDDVDVSKIDVQHLRSKLSVIPQDPVLFIGTLRHNLDPFDNHTDEELWSALEKAHMKNTVTNLPLKLETPVIENGENFSVGERQLICMGRALLRGSKILLLDEATAAIDTQTDAKIQDTIRDSFKDCTVLTIAHRLNTILECDKIMVMDDGKVAEFDTPSNLMSNPESHFAKMQKKSALVKE